MNRQTERKRADELKAANARTVLEKMPPVLRALTPGQIDQVQRFLDAQVINPQVEREFKELDRKSIIAESNGYTNRNPAIVAQRDKKSEEYIRLGDADKRIRLDVNKLLTQDAFTPETDNPDEAGYHIRVRNTLAGRGVWLRLDRRNPADHGKPISLPETDPKRYSFALSVGPDADSSLIPTMSGLLTREVLVRTSLFADNYFEHVVSGPTQKLLKGAIIELDTQAEHGWREQSAYEKIDLARVARGITEHYAPWISLPDIRIWGQARAKLQLATQELNKGHFAAAHDYISAAGGLITKVAVALDQYQNAVNVFGSRVVSVMEVTVKVVAVIESLNIVRSIGIKLFRALAVEGASVVAETGAGVGSGAAATQAAKKGSTTVLTGGSARPGAAANGNATVLTTGAGSSKPGGVARTLPPKPMSAKYGDKAFIDTKQVGQSYERAIQLGERRIDKATGNSRVSGAWSMTSEELAVEKRLDGFLKEFFQELSAYKKQHPRLPDYTVQTELIHQRLAAKWRISNPW